jgi:hypothetical protein
VKFLDLGKLIGDRKVPFQKGVIMSKVIFIGLPEHEIEEYIFEAENAEDGILVLFKRVIPHWDWLESMKLGVVQISGRTAEVIIGTLQKTFPNEKQKIIMLWMNYGFSVNPDIEDFKVRLDFDKLLYKEEEENGTN